MVRHKLRNKNFGQKRPVKVPMRKDTIAKKKKKKTDDEESKGKVDISVVKLALNSLVREEYMDVVTDKFKEYAQNGTEIMHLASLLMIYKVNDAFDRRELDFFNSIGTHVIVDSFRCVTSDNLSNRENTAQMPAEFEEMVLTHAADMEYTDQWPTRHRMARIVGALTDQYKSSLTTNLTTHCWTRLQFFLRVLCYDMNVDLDEADEFLNQYDEIDVRNTMKNLMLNENWIEDDDTHAEARRQKMGILFEAVRKRCGPSFDKYLTIKEYVQKEWFESLQLWIFIQRYVADFVAETKIMKREWKNFLSDPKVHPLPSLPQKRPNVKNFTVIPLCGTKLKHVKLDHTDLINLLGQLENDGIIELRPDYREYYAQNKDEAWGILFKINKIRQLKSGQFWHVLITNSVSACVLFARPKAKGFGLSDERIRDRYEKRPDQGGYKNECAVDPGERTKFACVRRDISTLVEVNWSKQIQSQNFQKKKILIK